MWFWLPLLWLAIVGMRSVSSGGDVVQEGSVRAVTTDDDVVVVALSGSRREVFEGRSKKMMSLPKVF